jgi:hypothetical protein
VFPKVWTVEVAPPVDLLENGLSPFEKIFMEGFFEWAMTK